MKIVSSGRGLHSPEFYNKKKRNKKIKIIVFLVFILALIGGLIYGAHQERFLITSIKISGETVVDDESIASTARSLIAGFYMFVLPRSNAFIYPQDKIEQTLLLKYPRLKTVEAHTENFNLLNISVSDRVPDALYCLGSAVLASSSDCYFTDKDGFVFDKAPAFSGGVYIAYSTDDRDKAPVGKKFITTEEFVTLNTFARELKNLGVYVNGLEIGREEYRIILPARGEIVWRRDADINIVYTNLEAFLANDAIKGDKDFLDKVSHIDLRTSNKVFYKFKGE